MRPDNTDGRSVAVPRARARQRTDTIFMLIAALLLAALLMIVAHPARVLSQGVALIRVDVAVVAKGHRMSKLIGSSVVNDKNERIGTLDDVIAARDRVLFAVLQVGGFLGLGGKLVALPYENLRIDDEGRKIELPGATKEELQKLAEFKYRS
jgi:hypothetical protein